MKLISFVPLAVPFLVACAAETPPEVPEENDVAQNAGALYVTQPTPQPTTSPYCLPGEVRKCTLGPPPVCTCEPAKLAPIIGAYAY
jgi:hypothetical protein